MLDCTRATQLLSTHYKLEAKLTRLAGDRDDNFRVDVDGEPRFVFKVMHPQCGTDNVALQCSALTSLADTSLNIPRVVLTQDAQQWSRVSDNDTTRIIWLLSWCPGTLLAEHRPHTAPIFASFGAVMAQLDNALGGLPFPGEHCGSHWNLTRAIESSVHTDYITHEARGVAQKVFEQFAQHTLPALNTLPHGLIHNDGNDYNVLVNQHGDTAVVDGLFDFGDLAWQPIICEVAIALAYLIMGKSDPLSVCAVFLGGYHRQRPLREDELSVLLDLIRTRLAVSIAISSQRQLTEPENSYITISQKPAIQSLLALDEITQEQARHCFEIACS